MASEPAALAPEDLAMLDRLASRVVELHMDVPAILALEGGQPLSLLASTSMIFFEPLVLSLFRLPDYRRFALLIERREAVEALARAIEQKAEQRRRERRDAALARRAARQADRG